MTLLRPSLGTSADIAVRHRVKPERRGCVSSACGAGVVRCWDRSWRRKKKLFGYENLLKPLKPLQRFGTGMQWILVAPAFAANESKSKREKFDFVTKLHF